MRRRHKERLKTPQVSFLDVNENPPSLPNRSLSFVYIIIYLYNWSGMTESELSELLYKCIRKLQKNVLLAAFKAIIILRVKTSSVRTDVIRSCYYLKPQRIFRVKFKIRILNIERFH